MSVYITLNREYAVLTDNTADANKANDGTGNVCTFGSIEAVKRAAPELRDPWRDMVLAAIAKAEGK